MIHHIGLIMDGNRRWAQNQGLLAVQGHKKGVDTIRMVCDYALNNDIKIVTLYAFSLENLKRSALEQNYLFSLIIQQAEQLVPELQKQQIKIRFLGDKSYFPAHVLPAVVTLEEQTSGGDKLLLNLLFCYGGRQDILSAAQHIAQDIKNGILSADNITDSVFRSYLQTKTLPDPDLIIRTGGMYRLSNFLPYESTYSELYFTNTFWPDFSKEEFSSIVQDFFSRKRNFGG